MKMFFRRAGVIFIFLVGCSYTSVAAQTPPGNSGKDILQLTMKESIALSIKNNLEIAIEKISPLIAEDAVEKNRAQFDSSLDFSANWGKSSTASASAFADPKESRVETQFFSAGTKSAFTTGTDASIALETSKNKTNSNNQSLNPEYNTSLNFSLTQNLLKDFGIDVNKSAITIATINKERTKFQFMNTVLSVVSSVKNTYWDLFYVIEDLKVKKENLNLAKQFENRVRTQVRIGVMAPIEITSSMAEVASREEDVIIAQKRIGDVEDNLKRLMNIDEKFWDTPISPVDSPKVTSVQGDFVRDMKDAFEFRPDYRQAKLRLESDNVDLAYKENQLYPDLDLSATLKLKGLSGDSKKVTFFGTTSESDFAGDYSESYNEAASGKFYDWKVGFTLTIPLGNRSAKSAYRTARLEIEKNVKTLKSIEQNIKLAVREARRRVSTALKRIEVTAVSRKLAEEKLTAEETRFKLGMSTSFNVLEYQRDLSDARNKELLAKTDYNKALVNIDLVTGRLLGRHQITIESL